MSVAPQYRRPLSRGLAFVLACALGLAGLVVVPALHMDVPRGLNVAMHTAMEAASVVVSLLVFSLGWATLGRDRRIVVPQMSAVFLAVALLDFVHLLFYDGMPVIVEPFNRGTAITLFLAARLLVAAAFVAIAFSTWNRPADAARQRLLFSGFAPLCPCRDCAGGVRAEPQHPDVRPREGADGAEGRDRLHDRVAEPRRRGRLRAASGQAAVLPGGGTARRVAGDGGVGVLLHTLCDDGRPVHQLRPCPEDRRLPDRVEGAVRQGGAWPVPGARGRAGGVEGRRREVPPAVRAEPGRGARAGRGQPREGRQPRGAHDVPAAGGRGDRRGHRGADGHRAGRACPLARRARRGGHGPGRGELRPAPTAAAWTSWRPRWRIATARAA